MSRSNLAALAVLLLLCIAPAAAAQVGSTTDILRGRVTGADGAPVRGALVEAWSASSGVRRATTTDAEGRYTLLFPDGGGAYRLRVSQIGSAPFEGTVTRAGDEEVLLRDVQLTTRPVEVDRVVATGRRQPPGRGEAGSTTRGMDGELARRLPLESTDPASIAALAPNVVGVTASDSIGGGFSVAGQRASQNQVTLDGATFASMLSGGAMGGGSGLPQEGMRSTQVITSTYDVARGQFSGGQVAMTTVAGTNTRQGSASYRLGSDLLQGGTSRTDWVGGYALNRFSGGIGGPLIRDRLFYNVSFEAQRRGDELFSLEPRAHTGFAALGVHADSVARFLDILGRTHGIEVDGQTGSYRRTGSSGSGLARVDLHPTEAHSLSLRGFASGFRLGGALIRPLDLIENGGTISSGGSGAIATLTSRFRTSWINEARASYTAQQQDLTPALALPEGRVRVNSEQADGGVGVSMLAFGGDPFPPRSSRESTLEIANELSLLVGASHRLKVGGLFNHTRFEQRTAVGANGIFSFQSLADLEAGRASAFTRALVSDPVAGSGWNAAFYLGDTWRPLDRLQLVYGLRAEASGFSESAAGVDLPGGLGDGRAPRETHVSPRAGFSLRLSPDGAPLRMLRGGLGEFRGRTPYSLHAGVLDAGAGAEAILSCAGDGQVPIADFARFRTDPSSVPDRCLDGSAGSRAGLPTAVAFAPGFQSPRSWRGSLGFQTSFRPTLSFSVDASYARGISQYGVRDLNIAESPAFVLDAEGGRPVFADATAIDPRSGGMPLAASRHDSRLGHAFQVHSDHRSESGAISLGLNGLLLPRRASFRTSYTLAFARDQSSFTFGSPADGFARTVPGLDRDAIPMRPADMDRRHSLNALVGMPFRGSWEVSVIGRAFSGAPFTPRVAGDVDGDGARNDAAFVFDPVTVADPAVAEGMTRLLEGSTAAARCLQAQVGRVAARNSCRGDWSGTLDLRVSHTPNVRSIGRRFSVGLDVYNVGAGLDLALHGADGRRGWGQGGMMVDQTLLHTAGFDPATRSYRYQVNERFGERLSRTSGMRSPFAMQLSGRLMVGPDRGPEPLGGFAGLGMGMSGGAVTRVVVSAGGEGAPPAGATPGNIRLQAGGGPGGSMLENFLPMPIDSILARAGELELSQEQQERLRAVQAQLLERNAPIRLEVGRALSGAGQSDNPQLLFDRIGPRINEGRRNIQAALEQAREILTSAQWEAIPAQIRNFGTGQMQIRGR